MGSKGVVTHSTELSSIICKRHCLDDLTGGGRREMFYTSGSFRSISVLGVGVGVLVDLKKNNSVLIIHLHMVD